VFSNTSVAADGTMSVDSVGEDEAIATSKPPSASHPEVAGTIRTRVTSANASATLTAGNVTKETTENDNAPAMVAGTDEFEGIAAVVVAAASVVVISVVVLTSVVITSSVSVTFAAVVSVALVVEASLVVEVSVVVAFITGSMVTAVVEVVSAVVVAAVVVVVVAAVVVSTVVRGVAVVVSAVVEVAVVVAVVVVVSGTFEHKKLNESRVLNG
jgi:hypothetical protein